jgi:uncharacterized alpha-E superfamily protein
MGPSLEAPIRNIHWMAVLKSCGSIEAYRRENFGEMDPGRVANFLILQRDFPRSIRFSVAAAHRAIATIRTGINAGGVDAAERILGRLDAQLEFAQRSEIEQTGVPEYLQGIESNIAAASAAMQRTYFQH